MRTRNREEEAAYFERFVRARPDLDLKGAAHGDAPDFVIARESSRLGIEITRHTPTDRDAAFKPEHQDALRVTVIARARELYDAGGGIPLHVQLVFNDDRPITSRRVEPLASELAGLLSVRPIHNVGVYENTRSPFMDDDEAYTSIPEVGGVNAYRVATADESGWGAGGAFFFRTADRADFDGMLAAKERRISQYRERVDEVWLLCVFEMLPGGWFVNVPRHVSFNVATSFDRVFALDRVSGFCAEIPVVAR